MVNNYLYILYDYTIKSIVICVIYYKSLNIKLTKTVTKSLDVQKIS